MPDTPGHERASLGEVFGTVLLLDDAAAVSEQLRDALRSLQKTSAQDVQAILAEHLIPEHVAKLSAWAQDAGRSLATPTDAQHVLTEARDYIARLPLMTLKTAVPLREAAARDVAELLTSSGPGFAKIELVHDSSIIGGVVIDWQGRRRDYSLRSKLSDGYITANL